VLRETRAFELTSEIFPLRYLGYLVEHVAIKDVNQDIENAASHRRSSSANPHERSAAKATACVRLDVPLELENQQHRRDRLARKARACDQNINACGFEAERI